MTPPHTTPVNARRNIIGFAGDMASFGIGAYFIPATTVLVGLSSRLTTDNVLIGLTSMAWTVGWYAPQFIAAQWLQGRPHMKPYVVGFSLVFRQALLLLAAWLWLTQAAAPELTVWIIIACITVFTIGDGIVSIAWFDMFARAFTSPMRARVGALGQVISSVFSLVPGLIVERLLSAQGPPFPSNYAAVLVCAWVMFQMSTLFLVFVKDVPEQAPPRATEAEKRPSLVSQIRLQWRSQPVFRRMLAARGLSLIETMAAPFYVVFIRGRLGLPDEAIGVFSIAYVVGSVLGSLTFGYMAQRFGAQRVSQTASFLHAFSALSALSVAVVPALAPIALAVFVLIIGLNGALNKQMMLGWIAYAMDISTPQTRTSTIATLNTLSGLISLSPALGGLLVNALTIGLGSTPAYATLFGLVGALAVLGFVLALRLPKPHHT